MTPLLRIALLLVLALPATAGAVEQFSYRVVEKKPQDPRLYIQGLQIVDGELYVSSGQYGRSALLRYDFDSGKMQGGVRLPDSVFAEGLTVLGDSVYQLTWHNRALLVYDREDLARRAVYKIPGEGYGLTHDGAQLIISDGTDRIHFMNPQTGHISHTIRVTENGAALHKLNELEWIDGKIWANVWQTDRIVVIEPGSGEVTASIDLTGLFPEARAKHRDHVLNGIARHPEDGSIWVTGKRWPWLFSIELVPAGEVEAETPVDSR